MKQNELEQWLRKVIPGFSACQAVPGDASVRAYYRVQTETNETVILMDARRQPEVVLPFVSLAKALRGQRVYAPIIRAFDEKIGFILLEDFGDTLLLEGLAEETVDAYYRAAMDGLVPLQHCTSVPGYTVPQFDEALFSGEFLLFTHWFCEVHHGVVLTTKDQALLASVFSSLLENAFSQPQVLVHRDYHSRNLLVLPEGGLGVIDFQDAVWGPITYDLVSLLRDCYVAWPRARVLKWVEYFYECLNGASLLSSISLTEFIRWFDLMGLQRHLKCIGIFSRLKERDSNPNYVQHIPRIMQYILEVCGAYKEYNALRDWLLIHFSEVCT